MAKATRVASATPEYIPDPAPAQEAWRLKSAERAVDDPAKLARAARIIRAALARGVLTPADLTADAELTSAVVVPPQTRPARHGRRAA